jgi:hypothetical protein
VHLWGDVGLRRQLVRDARVGIDHVGGGILKLRKDRLLRGHGLYWYDPNGIPDYAAPWRGA